MNEKHISGLPIAYFREISSWLHSVLNQDELLELIINSATRMMEAKASSLLLLDEKTRRLYFKVATGEKGKEVRQFQINMGEGIVGSRSPSVGAPQRVFARLRSRLRFRSRGGLHNPCCVISV